MRRLIVHLAIALLTFTTGIMSGAFWYARRSQSNNLFLNQQSEIAQSAQNTEEPEWPLTSELVSRALQTRVISTKRLRRNGDDEIVWRWLKQAIANYPQNFVKLNISETEHYSIVIYKSIIIDNTQLARINDQLKKQGLPLLQTGKRYARLQVNQSNILCPDWYGLIDLEAAELMYFEGMSG